MPLTKDVVTKQKRFKCKRLCPRLTSDESSS